MKQQLLFLLAAALATTAQAGALQWNLQGKTFDVDTVYHAKIGPGTTQTSLVLSGASDLRVFYTTTDISVPYTDLRVTKGAGMLNGVATLSNMYKSADKPGAHYFAGVNADFFGGTRPIGSVVVDGNTMFAYNNGWDSFYRTVDGAVGLGRVNFHGTATSATGSYGITGINTDRGEQALVLYNRFRGATTGTNTYGAELRVELLEGSIGFTGLARVRVASELTSTALSLSGDQLVLSGHGAGKAFLETLAVGDELTLTFDSDVPGGASLSQLVGGCPVILSDNVTLDTQGAIDHLVANHPRTAVGYDATATKVVMLVVDGRSQISKGCTSRMLADIMRHVGCTEALNFDGGGSTELYTPHLGIRNVPSDGRERTVTNALWAVSTAPADTEVAELAFEYHTTFTTPRYGYFTPRIYAYNKYGDVISTDFTDYTLSCPEALGEIVADGKSLFASGSGIHLLTASYGDVTATIPVEIGSKEPMFLKDNVMVDNHREYTVEVGAEVLGSIMKIDNSALTWTSDDPAIATVDEQGRVRGVAEGTTIVRGSVDAFTGAITVKVEIPQSRYEAIAPLDDAAAWDLGKVGLNTASVAAAPDGLRVDYNVKSTRSANFTLRYEKVLRALPDSVRVVFSCADGDVKSLIHGISANGGRTTPGTIKLDASGEKTVVLIPMSDILDTEEFANYPATFHYIKFDLAPVAGIDKQLTLHALDAVYTHLSAGAGVADLTDDSQAVRLVRHGDAIELLGAEGPVSVVNVAGVEVIRSASPVLSTATLRPGLYIVRTPASAHKLLIH